MARIFEDVELLDYGRRVHRSVKSESAGNQVRRDDRGDKGRTDLHLAVTAMSSPWCLGLDNADAGGTAPSRAIYTEFAWLARWPDGTFRVGDWNSSSLGSYGLTTLLLPPAELALDQRRARSSSAEIRVLPDELDLMFLAPELVVLGADAYNLHLLPSRGVIDRWEATIDHLPASWISLDVEEWDTPAEFRI